MVSEYSLVNFVFNYFESAAGHICFTNRFYLLEAILITKLIKCIVGLVEQLD